MPRLHDGAPDSPPMPFTFCHDRLVNRWSWEERRVRARREQNGHDDGSVPEKIREYFQARTHRHLTRDTGRRMTDNLIRFLKALRDCQARLDEQALEIQLSDEDEQP